MGQFRGPGAERAGAFARAGRGKRTSPVPGPAALHGAFSAAGCRSRAKQNVVPALRKEGRVF